MKNTAKVMMVAAAMITGTAVFAGPHHGRHHHKGNDGLALAAGIVHLVKEVIAPTPVVVAPAPAVVAPAPAVVAPAPVVVAPAPAVVAPAPVVVAPAPVVVAPPPRHYYRPAPPPRHNYRPAPPPRRPAPAPHRGGRPGRR